ncbi:hypothetical protein HMPREF1624_05388 [Sporothrix schenckii ATCC 58251]|uniref:CAP-Gly domain-containing protein n=1 Tax=Sporothrix schenckii (strain ATCC 58251 / de Perez 2211183) TaxID=1391915 RepID=U7PUI4_SPOS1|nr:hypothetical protein HMPREF1624_05388 [Sporothrix schenckii ATCC 58251]
MSLTTTATTLSPTTASVTTTISAGRPPQAQSSSFSSTTKTLPRSLRKRLPTPFTNTSSTSSSSTRAGRGLASSLSTPNLSSLFAAHARRAPGVQGVPPLPSLPHQPSVPLPLPLLTRKASLAALTSSSLATIPDATESYAFDTLNELAFPSNSDNSYNSNSNSNNNAPPATMAPLTPGRFASSMASYSGAPTSDDPVVAGDAVDVPGGMHGTVRFVGSVAGRKGVFAGVELHPDFATRGKNSGDVDGVSYFSTNIPGAGIFLPLNKAIRRDASPSAFPMTPTATNGTGLKLGNQNSINFTPPTPSLPKFSQSVSGGPLPRAPSPQHGTRRPPRTSLPRPDSPVRRLQMTPAPGSNGPRPSLPAATPAAKGGASSGADGAPGRFGSPTSTSKFSQSMRAPGTAAMGDPSKRGTGLGMLRGGPVDRKASIGPRSASALGSASNYGDDDNATPTNAGRVGRSNGSAGGSANGSVGSASSFSGQAQQRGIGRPPSRTASHMKNGSIATATTLANSSGNNDEEVERLRSELQDRDRQLKDQASTLADMESSLTELQGLIESSDGPLGPNPNGGGPGATPGGGADGFDGDDKDMAQLRALLREKNDKIAMLTAEFDTHRADFRSTIDTLEMASTETERVYEKKIEEMMQENQELESRLADVEAVAQQLKQLEELVQELEEGLEDARRGEAEARGEVEFLRGEVERTRTELRREREKAAMLVASGGGGRPGSGGVGVGPGTLVRGNSTSSNPSKDLEQKDDEIRGLKAIIHSLSQNAGVSDGSNNASNGGGSSHRRGESINERLAREALEREVADLRTLLDNKSTRETEMEREIEQLRLTGNGAAASSTNNLGAHRSSAMTVGSRSSLRDSRGTVVLARDFRESLNGGGLSSSGNNNSNGGSNNLSAHHNHSRSNSNPRTGNRSPDQVRKLPHHSRGPTLDTMPESDAYSSVTESSTLWCEICETNGHDILTCTNMFGSAAGAGAGAGAGANGAPPPASSDAPAQLDSRTGKDVVRAAFSSEAVAPMIPLKLGSVAAKTAPPPEVKILPNPMESGPVAGKESGVVDAGKWCALCERDGHDSVDCPFEDAF